MSVKHGLEAPHQDEAYGETFGASGGRSFPGSIHSTLVAEPLGDIFDSIHGTSGIQPAQERPLRLNASWTLVVRIRRGLWLKS